MAFLFELRALADGVRVCVVCHDAAEEDAFRAVRACELAPHAVDPPVARMVLIARQELSRVRMFDQKVEKVACDCDRLLFEHRNLAVTAATRIVVEELVPLGRSVDGGLNNSRPGISHQAGCAVGENNVVVHEPYFFVRSPRQISPKSIPDESFGHKRVAAARDSRRPTSRFCARTVRLRCRQRVPSR